MSDAALKAADELERLVRAVTYKQYRPERRFLNAVTFMDTSINLIDPNFHEAVERSGLWRLMEERPVVSFACDLGPAALHYDETRSPNGFPRYRRLSPPISEEEYLERARANAAWLRRRFSGALRLEHLNYFPTNTDAYALVCEPAFIGRALEVLDAELLFDVAHALISSAYLGRSIEEYCAVLPLHRVREVQLSACGTVNGVLEDVHEPPGSSDWKLLEWVCTRAPVEFITIEYYRRADRLVAAYRELAGHLDRLRSTRHPAAAGMP